MGQRSLVECHRLMSAPGQLHEMEMKMVNGRMMRVYKNLPASLRDFFQNAVTNFPDRTYIVFENERLTYAQVNEKVQALAAYLQSRFIRKGDRIAIAMRNYPEWIIAFFAIQAIGAIAVAPNAQLRLETVAFCVKDAGSRLCIVDEERTELANHGIPILLARSEEWKSIVSTGKKPSKVEIDADDDSIIFFTSGTTGTPKGVLSTQRGFLTNIPNAFMGGMRAIYRRGELPPAPDPKAEPKAILIATPFFHVTGLHSLLGLATALGAKAVLMFKWDVEKAVTLIQKEKVTHGGGVPAMVRMLVESKLPEKNTMEVFFYGGAPAPSELPKDAKRFPLASTSQAYGLTETNSVAVSHAAEDYFERPSSTGLATPVNDVLIVKDGVVQPPNALGEIWIRGPNVAKGYWNRPEETAKAFTADGFFKSGDIGRMDEDGFVYIADRIKDMVIRGGENIPTGMVEEVIYRNPKVMEVHCLGMPHRVLGEQVCVVVNPKPSKDLTEAEIIQVAKQHLPRHAIPTIVVIQKEPFERNANGKVVKREIKEVLLKQGYGEQGDKSKL